MGSRLKWTSALYISLLHPSPQLTYAGRCNEKASSALRRKQKPVALTYLRSKKQLEDLLRKRLGSLELLESTLIRVEGAYGDVEVTHLPASV
jgi:hypothetical protein